MAVMNPYQQRLLMQQLARRDPTALARLAGAQGGGLAGLVGGQPGDMSLLGLVEQPQMVTPASPAPMQPGREVMAPQTDVAPVGPGYAGEARPTTGEAILGQARMRAAEMQDAAARAAVVPEEIEQVLGSRETRYAEELEGLAEGQKQAGWEALALAGMRMAQSQSPYFMSALATGLEAGLTGYSAKKAAAAERKARLQEQKEQVVLDRLRAKRDEEARAQAAQAREMGLAGQIMEQEGTARKMAFEERTEPYRFRSAQLDPQEKQAGIDYTVSRTEGERAGAALDRARAGAVGMGGGAPAAGPARGQTVTANQLSAIENDYIKAMNEYNRINRRWVQAGKPNVNDGRPRNAAIARELIDAQRAWEAQERRLNQARGITVAPIGRSSKPAAGRSLDDLLRKYGG